MRACRYCGNPGHNVATCPTLRSAIRKGEPAALNYNTNSRRIKHLQKNVAAHLGLNQPTHTLPVSENAPTIRKSKTCSYCGGPRHTVRTCQKRKGTEKLNLKRGPISANRKSFVDFCKKSGFGVGALIGVKPGFANEWMVKQYGRLLMVVGFKLDRLGVGDYPFDSCIMVRSATTGKTGEFNMPKHLYKEMDVSNVNPYGGDDNLSLLKITTSVCLPAEMLTEEWVNVSGQHAEDVKIHLG